MRILRALALVLLFANLLLFAAVKGYLGGGGGGEAERLADQLDPQKIVIVRAGAEAEASHDEGTAAPPKAPWAAAAPVKDDERPGTAKPAAAAAGNAHSESCRRYSALPREKATRVVALAREAKLKVTQKSLEEPSSWWVNIPPQPSREDVDKRVAELRAAGVNDFFVVQESGANHYAVSLGLFKLERMAVDLRDKLRAKGVSQARVTARENAAAKVAVDIRGATDALDILGARVAAVMPEVAAQACNGGGQ